MSRCSSLMLAVVLLTPFCSRGNAENWPGWRGLRGDGTSLETNVPTEWDGDSGKNIRWKVAVPGSGYSSPVIHGDRIFLTSCDESEQTRL
ncbi:MAG: PQQ-binding-like beta-propeller repeat protein, partial [Rubripirellula sp.]